jgi:hypothetical protein
MAARPPAGQQTGQQTGPRDDSDSMATAIYPPLPPAEFDGFPPPAVPARLAGMSPESATTEEFPLLPPGGRAAAPTQVVAPVGPQRRPPAPTPPMEATQAHPGPYVDEPRESLFDDDDFSPGADFNPGRNADFNPSRREDFDSADDFDDRERPGRDRIDAMDDDDDDYESLSPGREWLLMGAQVGAGAIAGAAVFLAFSWLWGFQPIVAVLAALVVIVGLVFGVRRWRRADDLQTTVLAILAGLVVTVSPAALLLVRR